MKTKKIFIDIPRQQKYIFLLSTVNTLPVISDNTVLIHPGYHINYDIEHNTNKNELSYEHFDLLCHDIEVNNNLEEYSNTNILENHKKSNETSSKNRKKTKKIDKSYRLPSVPKNDIRRFFANMFMNTINSGEFHHAQSFFHTFMKPKCHFMTTQMLPSEQLVPPQVIGNGPLLFAHYFLGLHIMYPDIVLTMHRSRVVTFGMSKMTKVIIDMESQATKTVHIPYDMWVPREYMLLDLYSAQSVSQVSDTLNLTATTTAAAVTASSNRAILPTTTTIAAIAANANPATINDNTCSNTILLTATNAAIADTTTPSSSSAILPTTTTAPPTTTTTVPTTSINKTLAVTTTTTTSQNTKRTSKRRRKNSPKHSTTTSTTLPHFVPDQYIAQLSLIAQPLPEPLPLHTLGQLEFYLDEHNHVVSIELRSKLA